MALFKIYKRGQGYYTRLWSGLVTFAIAASGCYVLWRKLAVITNLWVKTLVPVGLCVVFGLVIFWLMNKPATADFMISAEGEIKKVSWSSRREIAVSTLIVIFVVFLMAIMLFAADMAFKSLFMYVIGI
ncbi:MAG: preprotein translocase subunit SecE [Planctomycetota bacterium]|nr:MAG: preprotein translocase subunit SecE [Planctomycetota bacterium]